MKTPKEQEDYIKRLEDAILFMARTLRTYGGAEISNQVLEILYPPDPKKFLECDSCRIKAGSPILCRGCLHNRALIEKLS